LEVEISRGVPIPKDASLVLPEDMRDELRVPLGPVLQEDELVDHLPADGQLCTVGDMTTETAHRLGLTIHLAVVDYQTKREPDRRWVTALAPVGGRTVEVRSPAGEITAELYNAIVEAWASRDDVKVVVDGEEDLASLPAILHAPGGATVIYGIPDTGLCLVQVDGHARDVVTDVLGRLDVRREGIPPQGGRQDGAGDRL
jgi:uncharacterized protein (UPF0218 family)